MSARARTTRKRTTPRRWALCSEEKEKGYMNSRGSAAILWSRSRPSVRCNRSTFPWPPESCYLRRGVSGKGNEETAGASLRPLQVHEHCLSCVETLFVVLNQREDVEALQLFA